MRPDSILLTTDYQEMKSWRETAMKLERENKRLHKKLDTLQTSLQALRDMTKVQCSDGNWNFDPYMHGMANGMIFSLSLFEGMRPEYLEAPTEWGKDLPAPEKPIAEENK